MAITSSTELEQHVIEMLVNNGYQPARYDLDTIARTTFEYRNGAFVRDMDDEEFFAHVESSPFYETVTTVIDGDNDGEVIEIVYGYKGWEIERTVHTNKKESN